LYIIFKQTNVGIVLKVIHYTYYTLVSFILTAY